MSRHRSITPSPPRKNRRFPQPDGLGLMGWLLPPRAFGSVRRGARAALALAALLLSSGAAATTLETLSFEELARHAELVFQGRVIATEVRETGQHNAIVTYVTFAVSDVLAGSHSGDMLELGYRGGKMKGRFSKVVGSSIPNVGEAGIYFVESTTRAMINPMLGWWQGHFRTYEANGKERVSTRDRKPVIGAKMGMSTAAQATFPAQRDALPPRVYGAPRMVATELVIDDTGRQRHRGMTVERFRSYILGVRAAVPSALGSPPGRIWEDRSR